MRYSRVPTCTVGVTGTRGSEAGVIFRLIEPIALNAKWYILYKNSDENQWQQQYTNAAGIIDMRTNAKSRGPWSYTVCSLHEWPKFPTVCGEVPRLGHSPSRWSAA